MIENTSSFNRADMRFFIWQNNINAVQYLCRLVILLIGLFLVGLAFWLIVMHASFAYWTNSAATILGFTIGPWAVIQTVFHKQLMLRKVSKIPELQTPRHYQIDADSITMQTTIGGTEVTNRFLTCSFACFWETADTVYIRLISDKKKHIFYYLCLHDDGYSQGSRAELLNWLKQHGVEKKTAKAP